LKKNSDNLSETAIQVDEEKSKQQLIDELNEMRQQIDTLRGKIIEVERKNEQLLKKFSEYNKAEDGQYHLLFNTNNDGVHLIDKDMNIISPESSEEMYQHIVETAFEGIWLVDADCKTTFVNKKIADLLGYSVDEMMGQSLYNFMDEEWQTIAKKHGEVRRQGIGEQYEFKYLRKDGESLWTITSVAPFIDRNNCFTGSLGMINDISERKKSEQALRESNRLVTDILNFLPDATLVIDHDGRVIAWNKAAEEMTGIKAEDILDKGFYEYAVPFYGYRRPILANHVFNYEQEWEPNYTNIQINGKILIGENICRTAKNPQAYLWAIATPLYDTQGNIMGAIESIRDITERKQAEISLTASEEKYRCIVETANEGIWLSDQDNKIAFVNEKFAKMLGYQVEDMVGCSFLDFVSEDNRQMANLLIDNNRKGISADSDFEFQCKDGSRLWAILSMTPIYNAGRTYVGSLGMVSDVTERIKLEMQMARLDRLNMVGQIAAGIGHEIRNPMTSVRGLLQILAENQNYCKDKGYFDLMIEELDRANAIITEFLSLAKDKAVELRLNNLNIIVENIFPLINAEAKVQNKYAQIRLDYTIPDLLLDVSEIRQIILNLGRNALEAMPAGKKMEIRTFRDGEEVVLSVQDQGSGIHPDILDKIGTPFITTKEEGTGLGLPVCYSIAARHNASIEVKSDSQGSTFWVRFKIPTL